VTGGGGADSMFRFWLERRGDMMKHCRKIKQRRGGTGEGKGRRQC
jgi:hypothetical protein